MACIADIPPRIHASPCRYVACRPFWRSSPGSHAAHPPVASRRTVHRHFNGTRQDALPERPSTLLYGVNPHYCYSVSPYYCYSASHTIAIVSIHTIAIVSVHTIAIVSIILIPKRGRTGCLSLEPMPREGHGRHHGVPGRPKRKMKPQRKRQEYKTAGTPEAT